MDIVYKIFFYERWSKMELNYLKDIYEELEEDERFEVSGGSAIASVIISGSFFAVGRPPVGPPGPAPSGCAARP